MISNLFYRSKPIHYVVLSTLFIVFYMWHFIREFDFFETIYSGSTLYFERFGVLLALLTTLLLSDYIIKKNKLDQSNTYIFFINALFYLIFWDVFSSSRLIIANLLMVFVIQNLISTENIVVSKQKLFNASLLICIASIFHFWMILYILVVFQSVLFNFQNDYKRFFVPLIAIVGSVCWLLIGSMFQINTLDLMIYEINQVDWMWTPFTSPFKEILFWVYVFWIGIAILSFFMHVDEMAKKSKDAYYKLFFILIISFCILFFSGNRTDNVLLYTFFPVSILLTKVIEKTTKSWIKNTILIVLLFTAIISYSSFYWESFLL